MAPTRRMSLLAVVAMVATSVVSSWPQPLNAAPPVAAADSARPAAATLGLFKSPMAAFEEVVCRTCQEDEQCTFYVVNGEHVPICGTYHRLGGGSCGSPGDNNLLASLTGAPCRHAAKRYVAA